MKSKILFILCFLAFYNFSYAQITTGYLSNNSVLNCSTSNPQGNLLYTYNFQPCVSGTYIVNLYKNGDFYASRNTYKPACVTTITNPDDGTTTTIFTAPSTILVNFAIDKYSLEPAEYHAVATFNGGLPFISNTIVIDSNPFYNNDYADCGASYDNSSSRCNGSLEVYEFEPETLLIVEKEIGRIFKVKNTGGTGYNMYALDDITLGNLSGYDYIKGYQDFDKPITAIEYTNDKKLLIGFEDGKILKINGLGGGGQNMFAVNETDSGFSSVSGYDYYVGHHKFNSGVIEIKHINNYTFVCLRLGKVLKVRQSGGGGDNLFAIEETPTGFTGIPGYPYYVGHHKFNGAAYKVFSNNSATFFAFSNKKLLKINNVGGAGQNMFAIEESYSGFTGIPGYPYYKGHAKFQGFVTQMEFQGSETTIGFDNGKLLKVAGTGGGGQNMFAIEETSGGFSGVSGYPYYKGFANYSSGVRKILTTGPFTFVSFNNGKLLKVHNTGGTGTDMYNATEDSNGFHTSDTAYGIQLVGSSNFETIPTDIDYIESTKELVVSFSNKKMFKSVEYGGAGYNCFAVAQKDQGFAPLLGYSYVTGTQIFPCSRGRNRSSIEEVEEEQTFNQKKIVEVVLAPNPVQNNFEITIKEFDTVKNASIQVFNSNGFKVQETSITTNNFRVDVTDLKKGLYFCKIQIDDEAYMEKIIKQ